VAEVTVELPDEVAEQLSRRATAQGRSANDLIAEAVRTALAQDPLGFIASFESSEVTGADASDFLERERFGS